MTTKARRRAAFDPGLLDGDDLLAPLLSPPQGPASPAPTDANPSTVPASDAPSLLVKQPKTTARALRSTRADRPQSKRSETEVPPPSSSSLVSVAVYLPDDLKALLARARGQRDGSSYARIAVEAVATHVDAIDEELQRKRAAEERPRSKKSRFAPPPQRSQVLRGPGGRQVQLLLTPAEAEWLSGIVETVGAYSRSALLATALEFELAGKARQPGDR